MLPINLCWRMFIIVIMVLTAVIGETWTARGNTLYVERSPKPKPTSSTPKPIYDFPYHSRKEWRARLPKDKQKLNTPVPYVVIHHSYHPPACYSFDECAQAMRTMQHMHMDNNNWSDIGYNFGVGSDGAAYEGRGFYTLGAHALHFNNVSIGICLIGDWTSCVPPPEQIKTAKALIRAGIELGAIKYNYKLIGHRQVRETECPGQILFEEIQKWEHYSPCPRNVSDLLMMDGIPKETKDAIRKTQSHLNMG